MTQNKHFKQRVRERMSKTGERYSTARRHVLNQKDRRKAKDRHPWHLPGNIPATTALRILLRQAGIEYSEPMLFGIAGGIGIGVFSFFYEKENFASFFVAGRHFWQDDLSYLNDAVARLGLTAVVKKASTPKAGEKALRALLEPGRPCIAWVDMAHLPHRGMPSSCSGGGYHVVTVYGIDDDNGTALVGDLGDEPVVVPLADLATARARIKKFEHRLLALEPGEVGSDLGDLVRAGLRTCHDGLVGKTSWKGAKKPFSLDALGEWADRMHGSKDKQRWEVVFAGSRLWHGLYSIHDFVENYHTGGGLCRPLFAEFLTEAAKALGEPGLKALAKRYHELGRLWSELAESALPEGEALFDQARALCVERAEAMHSGADAAVLRDIWQRIETLHKKGTAKFPLGEADAAKHRESLQVKLRELHEGEVAAHAETGAYLADVS